MMTNKSIWGPLFALTLVVSSLSYYIGYNYYERENSFKYVKGWNEGRSDIVRETNKIKELEQKDLKEAIHQWIYANHEKVSREIIDTIVNEAFNTNYPIMILAIIGAESNFVATARSSAGAMGLGQIMPKVYSELLKKEGIIKEIRDLYNITENIKAIEFALKYELKITKGDINKALVRYSGNATHYVQKVMTNYISLSFIERRVDLKYVTN